jgi:ribosomal protein S18 acetylase RimI-like enzyme
VVETTREMWRMIWTGDRAVQTDDRTVRLDDADVEALQLLYADGASAGESPDFFYPAMVSRGVFFGIYEERQLVAAAGTHLVSRDEGAAAMGNIYTRRDRRGRGLGRAVTMAVMRQLADIGTVGLNVRADNGAALSLYESLGFERHCPFYEAVALR